jgi:hypothetical protein
MVHPFRLLLYPQNRVLRRLRDSELDDGLGWNLDPLLCLGINPGARFPLLLHKLAKTGQDKFAVFFDRFVSEVAECIEEYSSGSFVGLGGCSERGLKFSLGHLYAWFMAAKPKDFKKSQFRLKATSPLRGGSLPGKRPYWVKILGGGMIFERWTWISLERNPEPSDA